MRLDHIVLWTKDPEVAVDFYSRVVGLTPVRYTEFAAGDAPFPSVRVSQDSIIDLMPLGGRAGQPVNHICLALSKSEYDALDQRLAAAGVDISVRLNNSYGAQGWAPQTFYFADPDGNVVEARYYD